jgi:hypothetical protein
MTNGLVIPERRLLELADRGLSKAEMAEDIGVDETAVERSLRKHGISLDNDRGCPGNSPAARAAWEADPTEVFGRDHDA